MRTLLLAAAFTLAAALAGCTSSSSEDGLDDGLPVDPYATVRGLLADVPCEVASVGDGTSANLRFLGNASFLDRGVGEVDIRGDLLLANPGVIDISDPLNMTVLAEFGDVDGLSSGGDAKWMPDNRSAVVGGGAVTLINLENATAPFVEDVWQLSEFAGPLSMLPQTLLNAHMLSTARIDGKDWVFVAPNSNSGVWVLSVEGEAPERHLEYVTQTLPVEGGPLGPHDMFVGLDAMTGDWLLYSADGFHGWLVFDINDPSAPFPVGGHVRPETGYTHTIQSGVVEGRRIVVTIQEVGVNVLEVYDATDLRAPILLATWQVGPGETTPQHNLNIVNGTLYVAHYSHGVYAFDLGAVVDATLPEVAAWGPVAHYDPEPGGISQPGFGGFTAAWDVVVKDGLLYVGGFGDPVYGVHVVGFGCNKVGDETLTSVG